MKQIQNNRKLVSLEDMFGSDEKTDNASREIATLPIEKLHAKHNHRFQINLGDKNKDLLQSILDFGVLEPVIVRPAGDEYEILAGHRRTAMAREAGLKEIPVVIKEG